MDKDDWFTLFVAFCMTLLAGWWVYGIINLIIKGIERVLA